MDILIFLDRYYTVAFQSIFAIVSIFVWNVDGIFAYVDAVFVIISPFADWYWIEVCNNFQKLLPGDIVLYSIVIFYMIGPVE